MPQSDLHGDFTASSFCIFRTPLLPFDELLNWGEGVEAPLVLNELKLLEQAVANDSIRLRARLDTALQRSEVREAIYVASPDLDDSFSVWKENPESKRGQRIEAALVRYYMRMAGRATPFGLFAGCSVGEVKQHTNLVLEGREKYRRSTRLDMDYLCALIEVLERNPVFRNSLIYHANSSLYRAGGRVRYLESRTLKDIRSYHLVAVENTSYLELALFLSEPGDHPPALAAKLAGADSEFSSQEAEEFISELIENQLLVSELMPALTGADPPVFAPRPDDPVVVLELAPSASWVRDQYPNEGVDDLGGGRLRVRLRISEEAWLERLLLRLGPEAKVVQGGAGAVDKAARRILVRYGAE